MEMTRRQAVGLAIGSSAALLGARVARGDETAPATPVLRRPPPAYRGSNEVKPLPFDPAHLRGLSEKLIRSHHENNYAGAVKRLNQIQKLIGTLPEDAAPFQVGSLKREELIASNSMVLHELYFGNLGGKGGLPPGAIREALEAEYGSADVWQREFRLGGLSLAGGSGWMILAYDPRRGAVHNYWAADHTHSPAGGVPLLVMDMYEHSYQMDYGANAKSYIDAFFENVDWEEVNRRIAEVRKGQAS